MEGESKKRKKSKKEVNQKKEEDDDEEIAKTSKREKKKQKSDKSEVIGQSQHSKDTSSNEKTSKSSKTSSNPPKEGKTIDDSQTTEQKKNETTNPSQLPPDNRLYVGNLPPTASKVDVLRFFKKCGRATYEPYVVGEKTVPEKCFVTFADSSAALKALQLSGTELKGSKVVVGVFREKKKKEKKAKMEKNTLAHLGPKGPNPNPQGTTLFMGRLPLNVTDDEIKQFFYDIGDITNIRRIFKRGKKGAKVFGGAAFITFSNPSIVEGAAKLLAGKEIRGSQIRLDWA